MDYMNLKEVCAELGISIATGKNWLRLGKITPDCTENNAPCFLKSAVEQWKKDISSDSGKVLKSRRNKRYVSGTGLYADYVSEQCSNVGAIQELLLKIDGAEEILSLLLADCAVKLFVQSRGMQRTGFPEDVLPGFLAGSFSFGEYDCLIYDLLEKETLGKEALVKEKIVRHPELFQTEYTYEKQEDVLGLLYLSCKNMGSRKAAGAYYTPTRVVKQLVNRLVKVTTEAQTDSKTLLDPCCGTGNFLLQLPEEFCPEHMFGCDIDEISIQLARINMALKFPGVAVEKWKQNIICRNFLLAEDEKKYGIILGNPPWGYAFSEEEKENLRKQYQTARGNTIESYDLFIEKALAKVKRGGVVSFVLPEAVLYVKSHRPVRKLLVEGTEVQYVSFLGNVFDKVQCPSVILQFQNTGERLNCLGLEVEMAQQRFTILKERMLSPESFSFGMTDEEYRVFRKMEELPGAVYLKNNADFAMGIVTGSNEACLQEEKTPENEPVLRGQDIEKFRAKAGEKYLVFKKTEFQQAAPETLYRAPEKLLYRFVSDRLVFAYDDKQTLSLNSCNIVIPRIPGLQMKYVLGILNSSAAQFFFQKKFHSVKVLRSHLEQIPVPMAAPEKQAEVVGLVERLLTYRAGEERKRCLEQLDAMIAQLYCLETEEYEKIKETTL